MLKQDEVNFLVEKGVIKNNSMVQICNQVYPGMKVPDYKIMKLYQNGNNWVDMTVKNIETDVNYKLPINRIVAIDDMKVERMVQAYSVEDELNTIDVIKKTNVNKTIVGKKSVKVNGTQLEDGMRLFLHNDSDKRMNNKVLTVRGVGSSIVLVAPRGRPKKIK